MSQGVAVVLIVVLAVAGVVDVVALATDRPTVSGVISGWSKAFPMLAVSVGVLIGHLFWPANAK